MGKENLFTEEKQEELLELLKEPYVYYADYRDTIETPFLKELIKDIENDPDESPINIFKDKLFEAYLGADYPDKKDYAKDIGLDYDDLSEEDKERFDEVFNDNIIVEPDYDHFLDQNICVNVIIDSGDYNYDLGCNQIYPHYDGDYDDLKENGIQKESCIHWLAEKQGYDEKTTRLALADNEFNNSKFLESLQEELMNCTSHMNCLVFLKEMTIREWLEALNEDSIEIPKRTTCGLIDFWNGAGGLINIQLEKNITVKKEEIHEIIPDECKRYSIHEIYGCTDRLWN